MNKVAIVIALMIIAAGCREKDTDAIIDKKIDPIIPKTMATYYVSTSGNNGNAGTQASPWRTVNYACSTAITSGDIIHIFPGTYPITSQASLALGVSIEGEGNTTILSCTVTSTNLWSIAGYAIALNSGSLANGNQHISNVKFDGNSLAGYGAIGVWNRSNVSVYNCTGVNFSHRFIRIYGGQPPVSAAAYIVGSKFYNNVITNCAAFIVGSGSMGALDICGIDGMLIYGNTITVHRAGANSGDPIMGVQGYLKNIKIYNNTITKTFVVGLTSWDFSIEFWNCLGGIEIYENELTGCIDLVHVEKGSETYGAWIHDNNIGEPTLLNSEGIRGIMLETHSPDRAKMEDLIIERNYIKNVAVGIGINNIHGAANFENMYIQYNIFDNIGRLNTDSKGWGVWWYPAGDGSMDNTINNFNVWNNVFIGYTGNTTRWAIELPDVGVATNISIRNNITVGFDYAPIYATASGRAGVTISGLSVENNNFYQCGNGNAPSYISITPAADVTQNNITSDPLFVSSSDFHLQAGSDAIDAGIDVGILYDYENSPVSDPPSIGAYEYGANIPVTTVTVTGEGGATTITVDYGTLQMYAHIDPHDASNQTVVWSVTNGTGTASISATGLLSAITDGTVTVKATSNG